MSQLQPTQQPISATEAKARLSILPPRPSEEQIVAAEKAVAGADAALVKELEGIVMTAPPVGQSPEDREKQQEENSVAAHKKALSAKEPFLRVIQTEMEHRSLEQIIRKAEENKSAKGKEVPLLNDQVTEVKVLEDIKSALDSGAQELDLSFKKLRFVPESFGKLVTLTSLNLSQNNLESIPDALAGLVSLLHLNVRSNKLTTLPDSVGLLKDLTFLDFSSNRVKYLPSSMVNNTNLVVLNGTLNDITDIPQRLCQSLVKLQELSLPYNKIQKVPDGFGGLFSLFTLNLRFNRIREISPSIGKLQSITTLDLSNNFADLVYLPISIANLSTLVELDVSNNQISALPLEMHRMSNLQRINLDGNPLICPPLEVAATKDVELIRAALAAEYASREASRQASLAEMIRWLAVNLGEWTNSMFYGDSTPRLGGLNPDGGPQVALSLEAGPPLGAEGAEHEESSLVPVSTNGGSTTELTEIVSRP